MEGIAWRAVRNLCRDCIGSSQGEGEGSGRAISAAATGDSGKSRSLRVPLVPMTCVTSFEQIFNFDQGWNWTLLAHDQAFLREVLLQRPQSFLI